MHYSLQELATANGLLTILLGAVLAFFYFGYDYIVQPKVWLVGSLLIWTMCLSCRTHCIVEKKEFGDISAIFNGLTALQLDDAGDQTQLEGIVFSLLTFAVAALLLAIKELGENERLKSFAPTGQLILSVLALLAFIQVFEGYSNYG